MITTKDITKRLGILAISGLFILVGTGCPMLGIMGGKTHVTLLFTNGGAKSALAVTPVSGKAVTPVSDVKSLTVTVTQVTLMPGEDDSSQDTTGESTAEDASDGTSSESGTVVFTGSLDVNLLDLTNLSEALSSANVPAGTYSQIRLAISNPRLVLNSDPNTTITNVQLTANGQLFVSDDFTLTAGQDNLIVLDFGGIHLVQEGNGGYLLTPQLRADVTVQSADVASVGTIANLDTSTHTFTLTLTNGSLNVDYTSADIYLSTDTTTPTGTESDLADGLTVEVVGTVDVQGNVTASAIYLQ